MRYRLSPEAANDIDQAAGFYAQISRAVAVQFIDAVFAAIELLLDNPLIGRFAENECRKFELGKFPFSLVYKLDSKSSEVVIYAVVHQMRRPGVWQNRIQEEAVTYVITASAGTQGVTNGSAHRCRITAAMSTQSSSTGWLRLVSTN